MSLFSFSFAIFIFLHVNFVYCNISQTCDDGAKILADWMIDDDFCDCFDGTDEPKTAACSHTGIMFLCQNQTPPFRKIPSSRVLDTVCDCFDGSDEKTGICPDTCKGEADASKLRAVNAYLDLLRAEQEKKNIIAGLQREASMKEKEITALEDTLSQLRSLQQELKVRQISENKKEYSEQLAVSRGFIIEDQTSFTYAAIGRRLSKGETSPMVHLDRRKIKWELSTLPTLQKVMQIEVPFNYETRGLKNLTLRTYLAYSYDPQIRESEVRRLKSDSAEELRKRTLLGVFLNNGPAGYLAGLRLVLNICGLPLAPVRGIIWVGGKVAYLISQGSFFVLTWVEQKVGISIISKFLAGFENDGIAVIHPALEYRRYDLLIKIVTFLEDTWGKISYYCMAMWDAPIDLYHLFVPSGATTYKRAEAELIRQSLQFIPGEINQTLLNLDEKTKYRTEFSAEMYGEERVFYALLNKCFEHLSGEFTYKLCVFKDLYQDGTLIGTWADWGEKENGPFGTKKMMHYTEGWACHGGQIRRGEVHVICGSTTGIISVEEPETCVYYIVFSSPLACDNHARSTAVHQLAEVGLSPDDALNQRHLQSREQTTKPEDNTSFEHREREEL